MSDYVVDTNVWAILDRDISTAESIEEAKCILACRGWLKQFVNSADRLVVDHLHYILGEYRSVIERVGHKGGLAEQHLNTLERSDDRLVYVPIEFDINDYAIIESLPKTFDNSDKKFMAVALNHAPIPLVVYAIDRGWNKHENELKALGIDLHKLCPDYLSDRLKLR